MYARLFLSLHINDILSVNIFKSTVTHVLVDPERETRYVCVCVCAVAVVPAVPRSGQGCKCDVKIFDLPPPVKEPLARIFAGIVYAQQQ